MAVETIVDGVAGAPGVAIGPAFLVDRRRAQLPRFHLAAHAVLAEHDRFMAAQQRALVEIDEVHARMEQLGSGEYLAILEAHRLMLRDPILVDGTKRRIATDLVNAEWALALTLKEVKAVFDRLTDDYFRERRSDIDVIGDRLQQALIGQEAPVATPPSAGAVLVAHDLSPADAIRLRDAKVAAIALNVGGKTSHTVILARALGLPAVVGLQRITESVGRGDIIVVDGDAGRVTLHPSEETTHTATERHRVFREKMRRRGRPVSGLVRTKDGTEIELQANVEFAQEAVSATRLGAHGVGLYRTEYLYMSRPDLPSEDEQATAYTIVAEAVRPQRVVLRTFDLGGDKFASPVKLGTTFDTASGLRAIRFAMRFPDILKTQLSAMLRASSSGEIGVMIPMISSLEELAFVKELMAAARHDVVSRGFVVAEKVPLGVMVELPAAVIIIRELLAESDFVSVGTNDLVQYTLGVDRVHQIDSGLYQPYHPSIVRSLATIANAAREAGKSASICGEMAAEPAYSALLLGLGFRRLSMNPIAIAGVRAALRRINARDAAAFAQKVLAARTTNASRAEIDSFNREHEIDVHA
ncbi:MAG: phosphoenolpyruvate--protein phosphotransferase [Deltaproteobacteria bacterium]|nr:phosphoenolpyruvate--protein phosphotransferase [Deltaproteobacteria bacterium]